MKQIVIRQLVIHQGNLPVLLKCLIKCCLDVCSSKFARLYNKVRVSIGLLCIIDPEIKRILNILMKRIDKVQSDNI